MIVIHLARKPIKGTVVRNSLTHGTGGVNIEASRVTGRWPANLVLGHQPGCFHTGNKEVPAYVINRWDDGAKPFGGGAGHPYTTTVQGPELAETWECVDGNGTRFGDAGGASRFFKQVKG